MEVTTIKEILLTILAFIGICVYAHYFVYAVSWGWHKGAAKVTKKVYNYHSNTPT